MQTKAQSYMAQCRSIVAFIFAAEDDRLCQDKTIQTKVRQVFFSLSSQKNYSLYALSIYRAPTTSFIRA